MDDVSPINPASMASECDSCAWYRPAREAETASGDVVTLWAYCAQNRRLCGRCDDYEAG